MPSATEFALRPIRSMYVPLRERIAEAVFVPGADLRTEGVIELERFGLAAPERSRYKPVGWSVLPRILPAREVSRNDVLVDYGSGMGRIVYEAAARYPFARVIGLELSRKLNQIAQENLDRNQHLIGRTEVELITADVLDYEPPPRCHGGGFRQSLHGGDVQDGDRQPARDSRTRASNHIFQSD